MNPSEIIDARRRHRIKMSTVNIEPPKSFFQAPIIDLPLIRRFEPLLMASALPILKYFRFFNERRISKTFSFLPDAISGGERWSKRAAFKYFGQHALMSNSQDVMVQGCGRGYGLPEFWLRLGLSRIVACDPLDLGSVWSDVNDKYFEKYARRVEFKHASVESLPFDDASFDVVSSEAVYEHISSLTQAVSEAHRVLIPGGYFCHGFGPLYFTFGGDHCSGEINFSEGYNHILLPDHEYRDSVDNDEIYKNSVDPHCNFWAKNGIFSYVTGREYVEKFSEKFERCFILAVISEAGLKFRSLFPEKWKILLDRGFLEEDLLLKSMYVCYRRSVY